MSRRRASRDRLLGALLAGLSWLFARVSFRRAQAWGQRIGNLGWRLSRRDRRRTLDHLAIAFPELDGTAHWALGRASFRHHGACLGEGLHLLRHGCPEVEAVVAVEGWEEVERLQAAGRAMVILTGHCGNWELLAATINCRGLGMKVVARDLGSQGLQGLLLRLRQRFGTVTIERGAPGAARQLLGTLRAGGALGMLIDQDTKVEGTWVPFFGRPAYTPLGAARLALRQGVAVVPAFIARQEDGHHRVRFLPPLDLAGCDEQAATARMTAAIEEQIRRVPAQWVWMHRRWRRQPAPSSAAATAATEAADTMPS